MTKDVVYNTWLQSYPSLVINNYRARPRNPKPLPFLLKGKRYQSYYSTDRQTNRQTDKQTKNRQTKDKQTEKQSNRQTDKQTNRQTGLHKDR